MQRKDKKTANLTEEELEALDTMIVADAVYEGILEQLNLDDDPLYRELILGMLKRQTKDHLVFAIWNNLSDEQAGHLRQIINQTSVTAPFFKHEDLLMEFAMMYPDLTDKVYASLTEFFQRFVEKFNEIREA